MNADWESITILIIDDTISDPSTIVSDLRPINYLVTQYANASNTLLKSTKHHQYFDAILANIDQPQAITDLEAIINDRLYRYPSIATYSNNGNIQRINGYQHFAISQDKQISADDITQMINNSIARKDQLVANFLSNTTRILLVEDDAINQKVVNMMLKPLECQIAVSNNGAEALEQASQENFDVILMDIGLPDIDGYEVTRRIRASHQNNQNTPIIAVTAFISDREIDQCFLAGMDDIITKPVNSKDLQLALACNVGTH